MKIVQKMPSIHIPIQKPDGSMEWVWYMFLQWLSEHLEDTDLSDYFTKEEINALLSAYYTKTETDDILSDYAIDSNVVHKTGDETIGGVKTFYDVVKLNDSANIYNTQYGLFDSTASSKYFNFVDKNDKTSAWIESRINNTEAGDTRLNIWARTYTDNTYTTPVNSVIALIAKPDGTKYATGPTPTEDTTSSVQLDTVGARNTKLQNYQPLLTAGTGINIDANNVISSTASGYHPDLFDTKWSDHIVNDVQWLRADTFSWQSGAVYEAAYKHLYDDFNNAGAWQHETIAGHTIGFKLAPDGHKITDATDASVSAVAAIYEDTGVAWYYIIDTENARFKLPRTKFGFVGLRDNVGDYIEAGLPNITGYLSTGFVQAQEGNGAFSVHLPKLNRNIPSGSDTYQSGWGWDFSASDSNTIYGSSTTVQSPASQMYLYFFVGNFTQTALENTAGLNAELFNDKVDKGHEVIAFQAPTAQNNHTWYRKYADGWVEQGGYVTTASDVQRTVSLPVQMNNVYYDVQIQREYASSPGATNANLTAMCVWGLTTTEFKCWDKYGTSIGIHWEVKGMAA